MTATTSSVPAKRSLSTLIDSSSSSAVKQQKISETQKQLNMTSAAQGLLIKRLSEDAQLPTRGSPLAAGYDLYR